MTLPTSKYTVSLEYMLVNCYITLFVPVNPLFSFFHSALADMYTHSASSNTDYVNINKKNPNENMTRYLLDKASGKNLGYFNRHYFIAASFAEQGDNGKHFVEKINYLTIMLLHHRQSTNLVHKA